MSQIKSKHNGIILAIISLMGISFCIYTLIQNIFLPNSQETLPIIGLSFITLCICLLALYIYICERYDIQSKFLDSLH